MPFASGVLTESYELDTYRDSYGTIIMLSDGADPEVFHAIAGLGDISGPSQSVNVIERLTHSTGSRYKGKSPGMIDAGELTFPVNYDPANPSHSDTSQFGLGYWFLNAVRRHVQIISAPDPEGTRQVRQFTGWVSQFGEDHPVEGHDVRNTTIQIDGTITQLADIELP